MLGVIIGHLKWGAPPAEKRLLRVIATGAGCEGTERWPVSWAGTGQA